MRQVESGVVYRICAVNDERWDVLRDSSSEPLASFHNKHAALAYAMSMARASPDWQLPLERRRDALRSIFNQPRVHE